MSSSLPLGILLNIASNIVFDKPLREVCYNDIYDIFSSNDDDTSDQDDKLSHIEQMRLKHKLSHIEQMRLKYRPTVAERNEQMRRKYRPTLKERIEDRKKSENQYY